MEFDTEGPSLVLNILRELFQIILDNYQPYIWQSFEAIMIQKQSMVILVKNKDNYYTKTTTASKSMGFDLSAIQSC